MAINWCTDKIAKRQGDERHHILTVHPLGRNEPSENKWHSVTEALVDLSVACGFDEIRENNALEVARRIATYEKDRGTLLMTREGHEADRSPAPITFEDVWNHVGLSTNASTLSRKEFVQHYGRLADPVFGESAHDRIERVYAPAPKAA